MNKTQKKFFFYLNLTTHLIQRFDKKESTIDFLRNKLIFTIKNCILFTVASSDLEQYMKDDSFIMSLRHIRPRRKFQIAIEALFMIDFPLLKNKFSFFLDRKHKRATIDISTPAETFSKHINVSELNETTTVRSLIILFQQDVFTLYVDCKEVAKQEMEINFSKLYHQSDEPVVKLVSSFI